MANILDIETPEFVSFLAGCNKIVVDHYTNNLPNLVAKPITAKSGRRYIKLLDDTSVFAFVDRTNGDVLKPASYKAPAKHARGNIFLSDNGLDLVGPFGPAYLK